MKNEDQIVKEEIHREFQLERIILFSDAVFAIVITLMAIEIRLPHSTEPMTKDLLEHHLWHLLPVGIAYMGGFLFIGSTWFHHLKLFGLLKTYDRGLILRNLTLLFFIGLFPFSASLVTTVSQGLLLPILVYFAVVMLCTMAQLWLQHYVLIKKPELCKGFAKEEVLRFKVTRAVFFTLLLTFVFVMITYTLIEDRRFKSFAWWWFFVFPFVLKYLKKRINV